MPPVHFPVSIGITYKTVNANRKNKRCVFKAKRKCRKLEFIDLFTLAKAFKLKFIAFFKVRQPLNWNLFASSLLHERLNWNLLTSSK